MLLIKISVVELILSLRRVTLPTQTLLKFCLVKIFSSLILCFPYQHNLHQKVNYVRGQLLKIVIFYQNCSIDCLSVDNRSHVHGIRDMWRQASLPLTCRLAVRVEREKPSCWLFEPVSLCSLLFHCHGTAMRLLASIIWYIWYKWRGLHEECSKIVFVR